MTREEAIVIMENERPHCGKSITFTEEEKCEAYDMAVAALKAEPCEDAVSRKAILQEMDKRHANKDMITKGFIKNLPPVTPKQRTGKWIKQKIGYGCSNCTLCTNDYGVGIYKFCPNCGAKMEGDSE